MKQSCVLDCPVGPVWIEAEADFVTRIAFGAAGTREDAPNGVLAEAARQLTEYFEADRRVFDLPLKPAGTPFQLLVWTELQKVAYGTTISYGELASRIGRPTASRAVGAANGQNPIAIVIPCHRVIGSSGKLTGYAGGLDVKHQLLAHERGFR